MGTREEELEAGAGRAGGRWELAVPHPEAKVVWGFSFPGSPARGRRVCGPLRQMAAEEAPVGTDGSLGEVTAPRGGWACPGRRAARPWGAPGPGEGGGRAQVRQGPRPGEQQGDAFATLDTWRRHAPVGGGERAVTAGAKPPRRGEGQKT